MSEQRAIAGLGGAGVLPAICGLGVTQIIGWGTTYTPIAVLGIDIGRELGLSRELVFGGLTIMLVISAIAAPQLGALVDRRGARSIMVAGSLGCALTMLCLAYAGGVASYALAWVIAGLSAPVVLSNAAQAGLAQLAGPHARRALTALMFFSGLSSFVFLPVTKALAEGIGWRNTYLVYAALHLFVCLPLHALVLPRRREPHEGIKHAAGEPIEGLLPGDLRRLVFLLLVVWCCMDGIISWGLAVNIVDVFQRFGLTREAAVWAWAIVGPVQSVSRVVELLSGGRYPVLITGIISAGLLPVAFLAFVPGGVTTTAAFAFGLIYGVSHGVYAIARAAIPLALFGHRGYGTLMGRLMLPQNLINAAAPVAFATAYSNFGPGAVLWLGAAAAVIGCAALCGLVWVCWPHARKHDPV